MIGVRLIRSWSPRCQPDRSEPPGPKRVCSGRRARHALQVALLDRIVAQTDGVPLFIEELTKAIPPDANYTFKHALVQDVSGATACPTSIPVSGWCRICYYPITSGADARHNCVAYDFAQIVW
jgi:hypothetical protein